MKKPSAKTETRSGQDGPIAAASTRPNKASAEQTQPVTVHIGSEPSRLPPMALPAIATSTMPASTPLFCMPDSRVDSPGV